MKELQNFVYKHMDSLKHHKRYLAMLTALSMLVTFIVPLILIEPADSMTKQRLMLLADDGTSSYPTSFDETISDNPSNMVPNAAGADGNQVGDVTYSPAQMDILTLLFGAANNGSGNLTHQALYEGCMTIEEALEVDKETYFLGYASDFCAFIEGDFTATEADAEGRMAVGGDLTFTKDWNYQIGSGDYATMKPLQSIDGYNEYDNIYGFASALVGGKMSRINTLSTGWGSNRDLNDASKFNPDDDKGHHAVNRTDKYSYTVYYNPNEGLFKKFIVGDVTNSTHYSKNNGDVKDVPYYANNLENESGNCKHDYPGDCVDCAETDAHRYLGNVNELAQMYSMPDGYTVGELIRDTFEYVRSRSEVLSHMQSIAADISPDGKKVVFDATGKVSSNADTVYFSIPSWSANYKEIEFKGIPQNANIVINCGTTDPVCISADSEDRKGTNGDWDVKTILNGVTISKSGTGVNNHEDSSRILYNFYNTNEVHINGSFNGTILSPNADAQSADDQCPGHLSGALIAKSYYGGLEFGYRPYRAGSDILGMTSGYEVPVDKLIANTSTLLPGAIFEIAEILLDENGNEISDNGKRAEQVLSIFESGNSTKYVALPSYVDFSGNTTYIGTSTKSEIVEVDKTESFGEIGTITSNIDIKAYGERIANDDGTVTYSNELDLNSAFNVGDEIYLVSNQKLSWSDWLNNSVSTQKLDDDKVYKITINRPLDNDATSFEVPANIPNCTGNSKIINVKTPTFTISKTDIKWGDEVTFTVDGFNVNKKYDFKYYLSSDTNNSIFTTKEATSTFTFDKPMPGNQKIILKVNTNGQEWTKSIDVNVNHNMELDVSKSEFTLGDSVTLSVENHPSDCQISYSANDSKEFINQRDKEAIFTPGKSGSYEIKANVSFWISGNNVNITLEPKAITVADKPYLSVSSNSVNVNETITFEVKNLPNDVTINNCIVNDQTISSENGVYQFAPTQAGDYTITVTLSDGVTLTETFKANDLSDLYIGLNSETYVSGQEAIFTLYNYPENVGITWEIFYWDTDNGRDDWTQITPNQGYYEVNGNQLKITFAKNTPHKVVVYFNGNEAISKEVAVENQTRMLSARSTINYLADETVQIATLSDNKFVLVSPNGEPIIKANLNLQSNNDYTIKYTCYSVNDEMTNGQAVKSEINNGNYVITCKAEDRITKIEIEVTTGYVKLNSGSLTYQSEATKTTHMSPYTSTPDGEKKYSLDIPADMQQLDSVTFKLAPNANAGEIGIKCWVKYSGTDNLQEMPNCKFTNGTFTLSGFTNNVEKIIIQNSTAGSELPIDSYSYIATTDGNVTDSVTHRDIREEHKYIIREAKAPQGYFKTDDYYEVTITETLNTENVDNDTIPMLVNTEIHVDYFKAIKDENGNTTGYEEKAHYYQAPLTIQYGTKEKSDGSGDSEPDLNTRIIEIGDETFTIKKNNDGGKITSVTSGDTELQLSEEKLLKDCKATEFTHNDKKYYYNPETMMIIPLPSENEKNLKFSNESGLLFKKVDERGVLVDGATITVTTGNEEVASFTDSSKLFNLSNFDAGVVYTFTETATPNGYETAKPVHFMLNEDKTKVKWWSEGETEPETYTLISEAVIEMVDDRILGAKLKLEKIDADTKDYLAGAIFELYASDDTLIKSGINAGNGEGVDIDLTTVEEAGSKFIENGYLKPGSYYLLETTRPVDSSNYPYKDPGKICFTVGDAANNYGITYVPNTSGGSGSGGSTDSDTTLTVVNQADQHMADVCMSDGSVINISNVTGIEIVVEVWTAANLRLYFTGTDIDSTDGFESKPTASNKFYVYKNENLNIDNLNKFQVHNWGDNKVVVRYVKVTATDGTNEKEYIFDDGTYNPVSTASLEDEISAAANGDEPAVIDEADADTKAPILAPVRGEDDNKTTLVIGNEVDDGKVDITVKKVWPNDGFDSARPSVTIKLWRTTTEITETERNNPSTIVNGQPVLDSDNNPVEVTLSGDTWSHTFTDLDSRYAAADGGFGQYYYYIIEDTVVGYTAASYTIVGNELTVTNELDSVEVEVEKIWNTDNADIIPESVTLQLQVRIESDVNGPLQLENYTWENVEGKTITLVKSVFNGLEIWSGDEFKITGLLKGKTYRLTENDVSGWRITDGSQKVLTINSDGNFTDLNGNTTDGKLSITNEPKPPETGSLTISKYWDTDEGKPGEVYVKLYRKAIEKYWPEQSAADVQQDYARLLQYSLYFYDANMCGDLAEDHSALAWRSNCHTEDEDYGGVNGGFHDAGDHVMFGLPQGYSASMLGWSYYEFKDAYDDLKQTAHLKAITEHFCDFFEQCIRENNGTTEILVQKGDGNVDHGYWGAPEKQNEDDTNHRKDEDQMFWVSNTGADIAAEYAAALALAYLNFNDGSQKYRDYLTAAEKLYAYANSVKNDKSGDRTWKMQDNNQYADGCLNKWGINLDETQKERELNVEYPGFYLSDACADDIAWAAGWLYLATGRSNQSYKDACFDLNNNVDSWAFSWNDVKLAAACVSAHVNSDQADPWAKAREYINGKNTSDFYFPGDNKCWGSARYNAALQMAALAVTKNDSKSDFKGWSKSQMAMILGNNSWGENGNSVCLVTGFAEKSAKNAHHRAASGWESIDEYKNPTHTTYDTDGKTLIGAMVGGPYFGVHNEDQMKQNGHTNLTNPATHGDYVDDLHDYCCNEVALDYQAGLVGAAAGLYHFFESGHTYEIPGVEKQYLQSEPEILIPPEYYVNNEVVMTVGTEVYLAALDFAESDVTWSITDNNGNATISDSGIFKALNAGKVTVKAESGTQVVTVEINIVNAENAQVAKFSNVSLNQKNAISKLDDESNANVVRLSSQETSIVYDREYPLTELLNAIYAAEKQVNSIEFEGHSGNLNLFINGTQIGNGWNVSNGFDLNENNISQPITSIKVQNWGSAGLTDIVFNCGYKPVIIRPSSYYVSRNNSFTVTYENKRSENIEWTTLPEGFNAVGDVISVGAVDSGTYTITGKDNGSGTSCTFSVVVLPAGKMAHEVDTSDRTGAWQIRVPVPGDLQDKVERIAIKFNKKGVTGNASFKIDGISGDENFTGIDDTLFYECDNNKDTLDNIFVVTYHNPDNVIPERIYFIYSTGYTFDITPEKTSLVLGEKTKLNVSNHTGEITWTQNDYVTITKELDGYYATLDYDASGSTIIMISGTDADEKSGSAEINVKPLSVNATGAVVGEKITVKTDNEPIDCNIEYNYEVVNNSQGRVTINGADITANTAGTVKIIAIAKHNGEEVSCATSSEITISPWTINGETSMEVDDVETFTSNRTGTFTWSSSKPDVATIDPNTGKVTAKSNGDTIITVSDGTYTSEPFTLVVNNKTFSFTINGEELDVNETYEIHEGESIELIPNLEVKSYDYDSEYIDINHDNLPHTITARAQTPNEITITATAADNQTVTFKIYVVGSFSIVDPNGESYATDESSRMMYNGERLQLRAINSVGNVHWAITPQGDDQIAIVDPDTGLVTAIKSGDVVVTATDENGTTATYNITVKLKAVDPGFDYSNGGFEEVREAYPNGRYITLTSGENWTKTIDGLKLTDENGNYYMYYIVECDGSGNPISSNGTIQSIQGIGATFVPTEYENGVMLAQVKTNAASVKNSLSGRVQGQLPSTGGSGVKTYYYFGGALMLLGIAGFTGLKRRERKRRKE